MKRFWAALGLCFNLTLAFASPLTSEDEAIAKAAKALEKDAPALMTPNVHQASADAQARQFMSELQSGTQLPRFEESVPRFEATVLLFVSESLGDIGLQAAYEVASRDQNIALVFRGVKDEKDIGQAIIRLQARARNLNPVPNIMIDPTLFKKYRIKKVPTLIALDDTRSHEIARVAGLIEPTYLSQQLRVSKKGDFGVRGDVQHIVERDLIEVMKERMAAIDWAKKKQEAVGRFWQNQHFVSLPRSTVERTRLLDPTIVVNEDVLLGDTVIAQAGQRINPLDTMPFTQAMVVFNATDNAQVEEILRQLPALKAKYPRVTLITTEFRREDGWDFFKQITDRLDSHLFKLTPEIKNRFELHKVPTIVTADAKQFYLRELAIQEKAP